MLMVLLYATAMLLLFQLIPSLLGMSVCELTSEPSALSAALWLIVKEDDVDKFPHAVQIAIKLFKTLPNLISPNAFCDMILDLKIKVYSC